MTGTAHKTWTREENTHNTVCVFSFLCAVPVMNHLQLARLSTLLLPFRFSPFFKISPRGSPTRLERVKAKEYSGRPLRGAPVSKIARFRRFGYPCACGGRAISTGAHVRVRGRSPDCFPSVFVSPISAGAGVGSVVLVRIRNTSASLVLGRTEPRGVRPHVRGRRIRPLVMLLSGRIISPPVSGGQQRTRRYCVTSRGDIIRNRRGFPIPLFLVIGVCNGRINGAMV